MPLAFERLGCSVPLGRVEAKKRGLQPDTCSLVVGMDEASVIADAASKIASVAWGRFPELAECWWFPTLLYTARPPEGLCAGDGIDMLGRNQIEMYRATSPAGLGRLLAVDAWEELLGVAAPDGNAAIETRRAIDTYNGPAQGWPEMLLAAREHERYVVSWAPSHRSLEFLGPREVIVELLQRCLLPGA